MTQLVIIDLQNGTNVKSLQIFEPKFELRFLTQSDLQPKDFQAVVALALLVYFGVYLFYVNV